MVEEAMKDAPVIEICFEFAEDIQALRHALIAFG